MGNDGGSIPDRRDLVKNKPKAEQADKNNQIIAQWFFCALSKQPLEQPVVSCALGKLYNGDAIIEYLVDKSKFGDGEEICGHIKLRKDVVTLTLAPNPTTKDEDSSDPHPKFACPLTMKPMNGLLPFVYLASCGCVFSAAGLRAINGPSLADSAVTDPEKPAPKDTSPCPQCTKPYTKADIRTINPGEEEAARMRTAMEIRAANKPKAKKRKAPAADASTEEQSKRVKREAPPPAVSATISVSRTVMESLAAEEKKRKAVMSSTVASLYKSKDDKPEKDGFMTRTFNRYA
jgi:hypothetical protein